MDKEKRDPCNVTCMTHQKVLRGISKDRAKERFGIWKALASWRAKAPEERDGFQSVPAGVKR
jgi:hypothetical protein